MYTHQNLCSYSLEICALDLCKFYLNKNTNFLMLKSTHCGSTQISAVFQPMHFRDTFKNHRNQIRIKKKKGQGAKEIWGITGNEIYTAGGFTKLPLYASLHVTHNSLREILFLCLFTDGKIKGHRDSMPYWEEAKLRTWVHRLQIHTCNHKQAIFSNLSQVRAIGVTECWRLTSPCSLFVPFQESSVVFL